eukprot:TRINITY_DN15033_c0_g1_i3.p2 TRINITY_DN15033_c0_g1~~TRINITY_DN15033_c0_g1_i3.p2  ORF type:complete len:148 (+),score=2.87 TRINITY_DN15033_c0_g1_i3:349-792(+)
MHQKSKPKQKFSQKLDILIFYKILLQQASNFQYVLLQINYIQMQQISNHPKNVFNLWSRMRSFVVWNKMSCLNKFKLICDQQQHFMLKILDLLYFIINLKGVEQLQIQIQSVIQEVSTSTFDLKIFTFVIFYQFFVVLLLAQAIVML